MKRMEVSQETVQQAIDFCEEVQKELIQMGNAVDQHFGYIGGGWKDEHYKKVRKVVDECLVKIDKSFQEAKELQLKLEKALKFVKEYDESVV